MALSFVLDLLVVLIMNKYLFDKLLAIMDARGSQYKRRALPDPRIVGACA
jgi:hypothetical protein